MDALSKNLYALNQTTEVNKPLQAQEKTSTQGAVSFRDVLGNTLGKQIHLSKHAALRLTDRNMNLTGDQMERVESAIVKADEKGIRDSLVLVDNMALIVNIKSKTIITAMNQDNEHVFSNIDGAVIV